MIEIDHQKLNLLTKRFMAGRPLFYSLIRPIEIYLMQQELQNVKGRVLDYGCGDGFLTELIFEGVDENKFNLTGVDLATSRINEAQDKQIYDELVVYDGRRLPFADNSFDVVISNSVLEHIPDLDQALVEMRRVLKPGGVFLATVMTDQWEQFLLGKKVLGDFYLRWLRKKQEHHQLLSAQKWQQQFEKHGFAVKKQVGYLPKRQTRWIEVLHYLSLPSLVSYKLF